MYLTVSEVWLKLYGAVRLQQDSPQSMQGNVRGATHTWWELWNNAVSGMFPRRPVGSDGGPSCCLKGDCV